MTLTTPLVVVPTVIAAALAIGSAWFFLKSQQDQASVHVQLRPNNDTTIELGVMVYAENCASCHGANLEGQLEDWQTPNEDGSMPAPPHDETGHTWHHPDEVLFDITKYGVAKAANLENYLSNMPAYQEILTDEEIVAVLSFIKSRWPNEVQHQHDELNRVFSERQPNTR